MAEPTVEEVLKIDEKKTESKPSLWPAVIFFFFIPPVGVFLLWKEKTFHKTLALLSAILGGLNLASGLLSLGAGHLLPVFSIIILSAGQTFFSVYLYKVAKERNYLEFWELTSLAVMVLLLDFVIIPLLFSWLIVDLVAPFFKQSLDQNQIYQQFPPQ